MVINFHLSDGGMACNVGGEVDNHNYPIHIPDEMLPKPIQEFLKKWSILHFKSLLYQGFRYDSSAYFHA